MQPLPAAFNSLFNVAGGVPYHLLARRYRSMLWRHYARQVEQSLLNWAPHASELVVVGPSAGWLLPQALLGRYQQVTAIEPDPLARWLLRRRFPGVAWQFDAHDYFDPYGPQPWRDGLHRLADRYPHQPFYFAEFLGQLIGLYPNAVAAERDGGVVEAPAFVAWKAEFRSIFGQRPVFSSHDRLVARTPPQTLHLRLPTELSAAELTSQLWSSEAEVADPLSGGLFPDVPREVALWQRQPGFWHAMELVASAPRGCRDAPAAPVLAPVR